MSIYTSVLNGLIQHSEGLRASGNNVHCKSGSFRGGPMGSPSFHIYRYFVLSLGPVLFGLVDLVHTVVRCEEFV